MNKWEILKEFIPKVEGFISYPKWDFKQWSWGYGTAAGFDINHKPHGTITREKAWEEALLHLKIDYNILSKRISVPLSEHQWAALLSFSYNEGVGNANNLIGDINAQSDTLEQHFKKYKYAGGKVNPTLVDRRNKEWILWKS